jgi:FAD/FMN-containing dehydrogenase
VFPYADEVILKTLHPTDDARPYRAPRGDTERSFRWLCELCHALPFALPALQRLAMKTIGESRVTGPAHQIFPSDRRVRFEEMEYELPRADGLAVLGEAIRWIRKRRLPVIFPFEFRWTAGDDIWLSPFNRGPCASISMHQYARRPWQALFRDAEPMVRAAGGRPHWAKRHTLTARDVFALYPRAREFCAVRRAVDPEGKFANPPLAALFEEDP